MIFQYSLLLILCGFTALSVSTETCGKDLLEGTSCIIKLPEKYNDKSNYIKWTHFSSDAVIERRNKKTKSNTPGLTMEEDGSLRFQSVSLKDTGTYIYTVTSSDGTEIGKGEAEIKVYEKVPKPTVKINCTADGNAALTCDVGNSKDPSLTVSWYEDGKLIQNEINPQVFLSSTQVQENKTYSCETHNPVSRVKSESVTVSFSTETYGKDLLVGTSCIIKLPEKYNGKSNDIKWAHFSSDAIIERRNKKTKSNTPGLTMEEDGSLRFQSVSLKDTGTYIYTVTSSDGTEIGKGEAEIKVYEKVPKPTVKISCTADGNAALTCDVENNKDLSLTVSWCKDGKLIQNEINPQVFLSSTQVQENKTYSFSTETCGKDLLEGTSCIIKLPEKYNDKSNDIKWAHFSSDAVIQRKNKKTKSNTPGLTVEEDGSLRFQSVSLKDTGTYIYTVTSSDGTEIDKGEVEIKVYEKAPKPTVKINCTADGNAALTCDVGNSKDPSLTVSWYEDGKLIQNEINHQVFLSSTQVQENKSYSCEKRNPVSRNKSESVTVSCIAKIFLCLRHKRDSSTL
ncbi:carcinoembryonic antigen-related cell adhesion molecule 5-like isoform X2 [Ctenopharyngodon idella]|uniref:carcinoembryonic antigen-related cell adhesion molecule 5-like isoform X1 n=2 Tax=Ctenopharyngodon idella TaxID=7959 RepID=UPI002230A701|nr:carcinoembryonic antigen-related cell adhesion molecule 5-like isoform X1 [Ctenopharyngodon idella]XP_051750396.1 carcinoembryonic antigen-related cell adhesion molecule 5-like isoform X2 [Ctenopharyngodon idella]